MASFSNSLGKKYNLVTRFILEPKCHCVSKSCGPPVNGQDSCKLHFGVWLSIPNSGEGEGSCQLGINRRCCINPTFKSAANLPTVSNFYTIRVSFNWGDATLFIFALIKLPRISMNTWPSHSLWVWTFFGHLLGIF